MCFFFSNMSSSFEFSVLVTCFLLLLSPLPHFLSLFFLFYFNLIIFWVLKATNKPLGNAKYGVKLSFQIMTLPNNSWTQHKNPKISPYPWLWYMNISCVFASKFNQPKQVHTLVELKWGRTSCLETKTRATTVLEVLDEDIKHMV